MPLDVSSRRAARQRAKIPKVLPHVAFAVLGNTQALAGAFPYDVTIWVDANIQILRGTFAATVVDAVRETGIAAVRHPKRDCIFDESRVSLGVETRHKYAGMPLREQADHYRVQGYPEHNGLFAGGVLGRYMHDRTIQAVDEAWWAEIERWSVQDQLSLPYVLWRLGVRCNAIDLNLWRNHLFEVLPHFDAAIDDLALRELPVPSAHPFRPRAGGDALGSYDSETGLWRLANGAEGHSFAFGSARSGFSPLMGDWDGDGLRSPGLYDPATGTFFLRNSLTSGPADAVFTFGPPRALPITGDWDGDGRDSIGFYLPDEGYWAFRNQNEPGRADFEVHFGERGKKLLPIAGDWDGSGRDRIGLYDPIHSSWFLREDLQAGAAEIAFNFGPHTGAPVVGDWNGDRADEIGVFLPEQSQAHLARTNRPSAPSWRTLIDPVGTTPITVRTLVTGERGSQARGTFSAE